MKIIFIGSVYFSFRALSKIIDIGGDVVGVCTLKESSFNSDFFDLRNYSLTHNIPCMYVNDINSATSLDWISAIGPDIIFCFGWSRILNDDILSIAPMGVVGFHPAALPANRGRHPITWALALGLKKTASTFFFMDNGVDSGDIISQTEILINEDDDAGILYDKIVSKALIQIEEFLPLLSSRNIQRIKQDDSKSNTWRKRGRKDGIIDWRMTARSIHNTVRALSKPYVGAEFNFNNVNYKVWKTEFVPCDIENVEPGKVIDVQSSGFPIIKCGQHAIRIVEIEPAFNVTLGMYL